MTVHSLVDFQSSLVGAFKHQVTSVSRKENKQAAPSDPVLSAGLHFLTPQPVGLIGMTWGSSAHRAVRPHGLWGFVLPFLCPNGSPPGRGRATLLAKRVTWWSRMSSELEKSYVCCILGSEEGFASN